MNVAIFILSSQKLLAGARVVPLVNWSKSSSWRVFSVADSACSCSRTLSVSAVVHARHAKIVSPLDADARWATPSPGLKRSSTMYGLDRLLLEVNALVDLDPAIVPPLFHPGKKMALIDIYVLSLCGIEQCPYIG